jgi:hypothetical protein
MKQRKESIARVVKAVYHPACVFWVLFYNIFMEGGDDELDRS